MRQRQLGRAEQPPSSRERSPLVLLSSPYETIPTFMGTGEVSGAIPGRRGRPQGLGAIEKKTECSPLWGERGHLAVVFPSAHLRVPVQFRLSSLMGPRVTQRVSCLTPSTPRFSAAFRRSQSSSASTSGSCWNAWTPLCTPLSRVGTSCAASACS